MTAIPSLASALDGQPRSTHPDRIHHTDLDPCEHAETHGVERDTDVQRAVFAVVLALCPGEKAERAKELRLDDERDVEVLHDRVDAHEGGGEAPEQTGNASVDDSAAYVPVVCERIGSGG